MTSDQRRIDLERLETGVYRARNARGNELTFGSEDPNGFTPVELLLAAIAGCSAVDVDHVTGRRSDFESFAASVTADYIRDDSGNILQNIVLSFDVQFPEGPEGDKARDMLPRIIKTSHDRTCTVSRTIEAGVSITAQVAEEG